MTLCQVFPRIVRLIKRLVLKEEPVMAVAIIYLGPEASVLPSLLKGMARDGLFNDLDACIAWHPDYETRVDVRGSQAMDDMEIEFFGKASHAAFDPWKGASALDAVEMTTFGINLLREHVKPSVRIHYVITQGGEVPNIVPEYAKLWLWVRDSTRLGVKNLRKRVEEIVG
jgi:aminobenzoyl-glutamate utilization protein B